MNMNVTPETVEPHGNPERTVFEDRFGLVIQKGRGGWVEEWLNDPSNRYRKDVRMTDGEDGSKILGIKSREAWKAIVQKQKSFPRAEDPAEKGFSR